MFVILENAGDHVTEGLDDSLMSRGSVEVPHLVQPPFELLPTTKSCMDLSRIRVLPERSVSELSIEDTTILFGINFSTTSKLYTRAGRSDLRSAVH